jgi:hypothetical protein
VLSPRGRGHRLDPIGIRQGAGALRQAAAAQYPNACMTDKVRRKSDDYPERVREAIEAILDRASPPVAKSSNRSLIRSAPLPNANAFRAPMRGEFTRGIATAATAPPSALVRALGRLAVLPGAVIGNRQWCSRS